MSSPNILFILADDLGWGDISCHGSPIRTPNVDRLMSEGIELGQHYVQPMCTPTRAALLTGRYPSRFGPLATFPSNRPVLPDGYQTLASVLKNGGYDTGLFGKWHLGSSPEFRPNEFGFNSSYGSLAGGVDPYNHRYKRGEYSFTWHRDGELVSEEGHVTDLITNEAIDWMESRVDPWFCYVPFTAVHVPIKAPQHWRDQYAFESYDEDSLKDESFKGYGAYTSHMDHAVGQMVESLERTGQRENTIIIFSSDNGALGAASLDATKTYPGWQEASPRLGSNLPYRGYKTQLYEGGIRTPTLINWKGTLEPGRMDHPVHVSDWMPTLTQLLGIAPTTDPQWDGQDIWPLITGEREEVADRQIYWNFRAGAGLCIRSGDWKLISTGGVGLGDGTVTSETAAGNSDDRCFELFNIADDPFEQRNLADEQETKVKELLEATYRQFSLDYTDERKDLDRYTDEVNIV
jgi:arylsulfatase A-like enzyme